MPEGQNSLYAQTTIYTASSHIGGLSRRSKWPIILCTTGCSPCSYGTLGKMIILRCDHQRPVCGRCKRRGLTARCFYHPAPLTKSRASGDEIVATENFNDIERAAPTAHLNKSPAISNKSKYVARSTHSATNSQGVPTFALPWSPMTPSSEAQLLPPHGRPSYKGPFREERLAPIKELLRHLRDYRFIQKLVNGYCTAAQAANPPATIIRSLAASLDDLVESYHLDQADPNDGQLSRLANNILRNTSRVVTITPDLDWKGFVALFTGDNLRIETVGLLLALAARACLLGLAWDDDKREDLVHSLAAASDVCLKTSREVSPTITDVLLWLAFDDVRLSTHVDGDSSLAVYRRLGELSTDIFESGIHRESSITLDTPCFLTECRRKTFAASYHIDKFVSALIDRPPRISKRYSDCKLPLDLADEDLLGDAARLETATSKLTAEGWNTTGHYVPTSWQRIRYVLGMLREEIYEFQNQPSSQDNILHLQALARRCRDFQEGLPAHLRYDPQCWPSDLAPNVCLMLTVLHLNYLQNYLQVQRLLAKNDPDASNVVIEVSADSLATVLHIGGSLNRAVFLRHDFAYVVLCYGLPAAAIIVSALQSLAKSAGDFSLPAGLSRSTLLRHLSVFVSHVESICTPGDGNYALCMQASKAFSRTLDELLDGNVPTAQEIPSLPTPHDPTITAQANADTMSMTDLDIFNGEGLDGIDLASWVKSIDWTGTGGEWSNF